jgi:predicted ester cyclase
MAMNDSVEAPRTAANAPPSTPPPDEGATQSQSAPPDSPSTGRTASPEAVARRLIEDGFSRGHVDVADELVAEDCVEHQDFGANYPRGPAGARAVIASLHQAFSDYRLTIEDLCVAGDVVWTRNLATGTNDGPFLGNAPTHRSMRVTVFDVMRVVHGKVVEHWGVPDRLGVLLQLGALQLPRR